MPTVSRTTPTVLMVDRDLGLALLSADAAAMTTSYGIGPEASPGDAVTVVGATPTVGHRQRRCRWSSHARRLVGSTPGHAGRQRRRSVGGDLQSRVIGPGVGQRCQRRCNAAAGQAGKGRAVDGPAHHRQRSGCPRDRQGRRRRTIAAAGIVAGDVITAVDGVAVTSVDQVKAAIVAHAPNDIVTLTHDARRSNICRHRRHRRHSPVDVASAQRVCVALGAPLARC